MKKKGSCFSLRYIRLFPFYGYFPKDSFTFIMENAVNTNGRCKKVPFKLQHLYTTVNMKKKKEEAFLYYIIN